MSQETEATLRNALDAIDRMRRRILALGWLTVAVTIGAYAYFAHVESASDSLERLLVTAVTALTCLIATTSYAVILIVVRMTTRILRAIYLVAKIPVADSR